MTIEDKLKPLREQIDALDKQILGLLSQRANVALEVGHVKAAVNAPVFRPEREAQVLRQIGENNPGPLRTTDVQTIFREIMSACRALERRVKVAYLGPVGTFSEQAVYQQFGHAVDAIPCLSFDEVFHIAESGLADFGVVPVENSSEGAVSRTLDLLLQTSLTISGEISILVHHSLMTQTGEMEGVKRICAHSQALAQCQVWLNQNYPGIERQAVVSNSEAARIAAEDPTCAAIAGEIAGETYKLQVVKGHIQDDPHNRTRFAVIGRLHSLPTGKDHTSMILAVPNKAGALYHLLTPLEKHGVSMTRFESRPARKGAWEYYFYVDIEGHAMDAKVADALAELKASSAFFKVLGSYPIAE